MTRPPSDDSPDNVRHLADRQPVGLVPGGLEPEPEPAPEYVRPDIPGLLSQLADRLRFDIECTEQIHRTTITVLEIRLEQLVEQRDWAFVNRDTHYQRVLQLEAENAELRAQLEERG